MSRGFELKEDDGGTKERLMKIIEEDKKGIADTFEQAMDEWWNKVWATARQLCIEYGAVDTWTLYNSIRIELIVAGPSGAYAVERYPEGVTVTRMIVAGGGMFINPKTGRVCDYAESVHEGTGKNITKGPRPFLTDAIEINRPELDAIIAKFLSKIKE